MGIPFTRDPHPRPPIYTPNVVPQCVSFTRDPPPETPTIPLPTSLIVNPSQVCI